MTSENLMEKWESLLLDRQEILTTKRLESTLGSWKEANDLLGQLHLNCIQKNISIEPIWAVVGIQHSNSNGKEEIVCMLTGGESSLEAVKASMKQICSITLYSLQKTLPSDPSFLISYALDEEKDREMMNNSSEKMKENLISEPIQAAPETIAKIEKTNAVQEPPKKKEKVAKQASLMSFFKK